MYVLCWLKIGTLTRLTEGQKYSGSSLLELPFIIIPANYNGYHDFYRQKWLKVSRERQGKRKQRKHYQCSFVEYVVCERVKPCFFFNTYKQNLRMYVVAEVVCCWGCKYTRICGLAGLRLSSLEQVAGHTAKV